MRNASAGQTTALTTPTTKPASSASTGLSIVNPSRIAARTHSAIAVITVTSRLRQATCRHDGRRSAGRMIRDRVFRVLGVFVVHDQARVRLVSWARRSRS